ncbi:MAG: alpha/beta hydrolase [Pleurocapsa sp. SU_5_0]|nr:alpha/beta hydrolase [Pleurocapsa sp. SU_5_0]NJR45852.1 alpha/beta hydrolase [Hyellaceae cyanobacterium CSU_1_1]
MREATGLKWFRQVAIAFIGAGALIFLTPSRVLSSEKVIFTDGGLSQSISLEELQDFADTGKVSPALNTLLKHGKQNPFVMRRILRQEFPANNKLISDLLNTIPGEYVLSQTGNVVSSKTEVANVTALRGALVTSASDNNLISLIELLENYPTPEVYVNGKILAKLRTNFVHFVEGSSQYINIPLSLLDKDTIKRLSKI